MTHRPIDSPPDRPFPVVVMTGDVPRVHLIEDVRRPPELSAGSSYLIPSGSDDAVEDRLNETPPSSTEGGWVVDVRRLTPDRQHIELYWLNDGFSGGGYEATRSTVLPRYRKITGPGFAFVFGGIAFVINVAIWLVLALAIWIWRRLKRSGLNKVMAD